jgi:hypothetical protein
MLEIIVTITFVISLGGVLFILARKMPVLADLPQNGGARKREKHHLIVNIESRIKKVSTFFEKQIFLHKFLMRVKIMIVKVDTKIDSLLRKVRNRAQEVNKKTKGVK